MKKLQTANFVDRAGVAPGPLPSLGIPARRLPPTAAAVLGALLLSSVSLAQEDDQTDYYGNAPQYAPDPYGNDPNAELAQTISDQGYPCDMVSRVALLDDSLRVVSCTIAGDMGNSVNYVVDPHGRVVSNNTRPRR